MLNFNFLKKGLGIVFPPQSNHLKNQLKIIFIIFTRLSVARKYLRPASAPLKL